ncbi:MAG: class I SAM-dependent methyltransferase [Spirochaetes bacterium]|nr:class I SAM-dependent methyltransferase [Spirochaetota bacterium]
MVRSGQRQWDCHYQKEKSQLAYPDENMVRLTTLFLKQNKGKHLQALDLGCGSGRHVITLKEMGFDVVIGSDYSMEAILNSSKKISAQFVVAQNTMLPFRDSSFDLVISWGSLHYSEKQYLSCMISEIQRVLKKGGWHIGTLRSFRDTYARRGKHLGNNVWQTNLEDLKGTIVSFYDEDELKSALSSYQAFAYGIMERTIPGDMSQRISHWYFWAKR